jgi:hypothetical protein
LATRASIYLPDSTAARLETLKHRINVSAVCVSALEREIERMQLLDRGKDNQQAVIERLRQEKFAAHAEDERSGREQAAKDVNELSYAQLRSLALSQEQILNRERPDHPVRYYHHLPEQVRQQFEDDYADPFFHDTDAEVWARGWFAYVQEWWQDIQDKL